MTAGTPKLAPEDYPKFFEVLRFSVMQNLSGAESDGDTMAYSMAEHANDLGLGSYNPIYMRGFLDAATLLMLSDDSVDVLVQLRADIAAFNDSGSAVAVTAKNPLKPIN